MDDFKKEFVMSLFLEHDSVATINKLAVTIANIVNENSENLSMFNDAIKKEHNIEEKIVTKHHLEGFPVTRRIKGYYEQTVLNLNDEEYFERFRVKKTTVQALITLLKSHVKPGNISLDKKVHVFLSAMMTDSSYNEIGRLFGLHKSSVSYVFHEIATQLTEQRYNFITWPTVEEQHFTRIKVNSRFKFPNCVGFIDACRFKVGSKRNKRDKPNIVLLQAVCDESLMFIDIHIGVMGKTRKNKIFKDSKLSQELKNFIDFENHILGDSEYKLRKNLIVPFTSEEVLTSEEMKFNEVHWKARSYIGHAFELLKERFRRLNHIDVVNPESVEVLISAACVLHNLILLHDGCPEVKEEVITCDDGVTMDSSIVKTAVEKRQFLSDYINYINTENEQFE